MTAIDPSSLTMSTYTAFPYVDEGGVVRCNYQDAAGHPVRRDALDCHAQGFKVDFLCIRAQHPTLPAAVRKDNGGVDNLVLFAAVAKTLEDNAGMTNLILADEQQRVVIPAMPGTRRGVILIYKRVGDDGAVGLIATTDPEIKNSVFG